MQLSISLQGDQSILSKLNQAVTSLKDWSKEFQAVGTYLLQLNEQIFATEGSIINEQWQALSEPYATEKAHKYPGAGILVATGTMKNAWTINVTPTQFTFYNPTIYAAAQNYGYPSRNLPARTFFKIDDIRKQNIHDVIAQTFQERINLNG